MLPDTFISPPNTQEVWTGKNNNNNNNCSLFFRWRMCRCRQIWPPADWGRSQLSPAQLRCVPHDRSRGRPPWRERCRHSDCRGPWLPSQNPTPRGRHACEVVKQGWERGEREGKVRRERERRENTVVFIMTEKQKILASVDRTATNKPVVLHNQILKEHYKQKQHWCDFCLIHFIYLFVPFL